MDQKEINQEIDTRFQIILTLSILFPTLLATVMDNVGADKKQVTGTSLGWSSLIGGLLLCYVIFSITKKLKLSNWVRVWVNGLLIFGISLFIFPIIFLSTAPSNEPISSWTNYMGLQGSLWGLLISPFLILLVFVIGCVKYVWVKIKHKK